MPNVLRDISFEHAELVSTVDKGASGNAEVRPRIVLIKKEDKGAKGMTLVERMKALVGKRTEEVFDTSAKEVAAEEVEKAGNAKAAMVEMIETSGMSDEMKAAMKATFLMALEATPPAPEADEPMPVPPVEEEKLVDDGTSADKEEDKDEMAKVMKSLPETVRKQFETLAAQNSELAETIAKAEVEKAHREQVEVAKQFPNVAGDVEKRAAMLLSVKKNQGDAVYDELVATFKSAEKVAKRGAEEGCFSEIGSGGGEYQGSDDGKFQAAVEKICKKDGCTEQQAFMKAAEANPKLYAAYKASAE